MSNSSSDVITPARGFAIIAGAFAALFALIVGLIYVVAFCAAWNSATAGQVLVVRNGGWFAGANIRQIIMPGSSMTFSGLFSTVHGYPAQQRQYTISALPDQGDRPGVDVVSVPSSDGVQMGINGTFEFALNLDPATLRAFDDKFGTRTYLGVDGNTYYPWQGDTGWDAFLNQVVRPVLDNVLRDQVGDFRCADLVSSCALINNGSAGTAAVASSVANGSNSQNIATVQNAINTAMAADLKANLGGDYLTGIHFIAGQVTLPTGVQDEINAAQAAYAKVAENDAQVAQAQALAKANEIRQQGYNACPVCGSIDELKALPPGVTTLALGSSGLALTPGK